MQRLFRHRYCVPLGSLIRLQCRPAPHRGFPYKALIAHDVHTFYREVFDQCLAESPRIHGNLQHDFHIAVMMREHGVTQILTEDRDFVMFPWVEILRLSR